MVNKDKVIAGLECCTQHGSMCGINCDGYYERYTKDGFAIKRVNEYRSKCSYGKCKTGCVKTLAIHALELLKGQQWISVKDRLPEKYGKNDHKADVMLYIPKREGVRQHGIYLGFLGEKPIPPDDGSGNFWHLSTSGSDWTVWGWSYFEGPIVTHWMPLPEPPKE